MGYISEKRFQKLVEKHERYIKENTDNWRSCKAVVCNEEVGEMIVEDAYLPFSSFEFTTFNKTTFINANFQAANFISCCFNDCNFIRCNFQDVSFKNDRFDGCRFTGSKLNSCIFNDCSITTSKAMSDDIIKELGYEMSRTINIIGSVFKQCTFINAFAEDVYFINNSVTGCGFYGCDFSLLDIYGNNAYRDNRTVFIDCNFHDDDNENIPDLPMACPRAGSFIAYKKVNVRYCNGFIPSDIGSTAIAVLQVPASAKRLSANCKKCRCDRAKVLRFETLGGERIKNPEKYTFISMHDPAFNYIVGQTITPEFAFNTDRWTECASGIHFFMNREDAVFY